ncbi:MAG: PIN domain-containing protein [Candidatus Daviesbacteria bacterium]
MSKFRFWATVTLAAVLGIVGFILGEFLPLPEPYTPTQSRIMYALFGILIGLLSYAQIASWIVRTVSNLARQLATNLALEVSHQVNLRRQAEPVPEIGESLEGAIIVDTSSIIDGRFLDVAKNGFLCGKVILPEFVLTELQTVADSADPLKRARGRRGLEMVHDLKRVRGVQLEILDKQLDLVAHLKDSKEVDDKLIVLAKALRAKILTCDFNLNRVARIRGVEVLNLNDLANALKTLPVPGEKLKIKLVHLGKDKDQGVGYLPDGTMVIVKDGDSLIGQETEVEVTKILQNPSGRILFGKRS